LNDLVVDDIQITGLPTDIVEINEPTKGGGADTLQGGLHDGDVDHWDMVTQAVKKSKEVTQAKAKIDAILKDMQNKLNAGTGPQFELAEDDRVSKLTNMIQTMRKRTIMKLKSSKTTDPSYATFLDISNQWTTQIDKILLKE